jgi:hypothetical protein
MNEPFDRYLILRCPAALLEQANHLINCFESCPPGHTILQLRGRTDYAQISVPCRASWVAGVKAIIAGQASLPEPHWNSDLTDPETGAVIGRLVDMAQANAALAATRLVEALGDSPDHIEVLA